jgi:valyl-tRNA synthetase
MQKNYDHKLYEEEIIKRWEEAGIFKARNDTAKKPFTIVLPPPNASGKMHTGNVLMIAIEDILIRWHKMKGEETLWIPGTDHAGTETQITFERELKKQGKSRFSYNRQDFYEEVWKFVQANKTLVEGQIRRMGAGVDWSRNKFTLEPEVVSLVCKTFEKLYQDGLVYRGDYMVNYCPKCGTTYADIEINHIERVDPLYYIKYGSLVVATVRPETKFGDTAVAVNPADTRYKDWIGSEIEVEGLSGKFKLKVIGDEFVDPKFGTGVVKVTPAHDPNDYEMGKKHNLATVKVIELNGKLTEVAGKYAGLSVFTARKQVVDDLKAKGLIDKVDEHYSHSVAVCKAGHDVEPTILPNWFVKMDSLRKPALEAVKEGRVKIYPKWRTLTYIRWMENIHDWAISRQNIWGIRIPVWYSSKENPNLIVSFINTDGTVVNGRLAELLRNYTLEDIKKGLQVLMAPAESKYKISVEKPSEDCLQETDTFDTWFSSGQWPLAILGYPESEDFKYFYPTNVLETGWEILSKWVSRMMMLGIYLTGEPPFKNVYLHGIVRALDGRKMSKSLGNVINPEEYIDEFGVDALRMGLVAGTATGKDFSFPRDRIVGYKKFANKLWNVARFIEPVLAAKQSSDSSTNEDDQWILHELELVIEKVDSSLEKYRFAEAAEILYEFIWHKLADVYLEKVKDRREEASQTLSKALDICLRLLHPFMPFVTEAVWKEVFLDEGLLISQEWPESK